MWTLRKGDNLSVLKGVLPKRKHLLRDPNRGGLLCVTQSCKRANGGESLSQGTQSSPAEVTACTSQLHGISSRQLALIYYNPRVLRTILSKFLKYLVSYCSHFYARMPFTCFSFLSFLLDSKISDGCNLQSLVTILREVEEDQMLPTPEPMRSQIGNE